MAVASPIVPPWRPVVALGAVYSPAGFPGAALAIPARGAVLVAAADERPLLEAIQAQLRQVKRWPAVERPLHQKLPDDRGVLEAVPAIAAVHEQPLSAWHPIDHRVQIGAHIVNSRVAAAEHRAPHHREAPPHVVAVRLHHVP